ncbi:MAG: C10 family peptidase [Bacteroidetes bacterium]|uniref:C10 family peptidase n=1 Tax=Candidatus Pullibacteroides excrementavium TaxID=2840905 RepID=A0A9D9DSG1_9BACT|nr:C10 family peptidase [Candidatus Pullibacteroides excrementavium]
MKKIFLWGSVLFLSMPMWAQTPPMAEVQRAAGNYMKAMCPQTKLTVKTVHPNAMALGDAGLNANPMSNLIEYAQGGWILMSNDYNVQPVLAYSPTGAWTADTSQMSPALVELLLDYVRQIDTIKRATQTKSATALASYAENRAKWEGLKSLNSSYLKSLVAKKAADAVVDDLLTDDSRKGEVIWGQSKNNSGGTSPKYNKFAPSGWESSGCNETKRKPIGCASVAMGQLMWYWKFPPQYDWEKMPAYLENSSTVQEENNIAHLLRDCADEAGVSFMCLGSWTTTNKVEEGMRAMHFPQSNKRRRGDRDEGEWWPDLIKSQLDNGWPVLYRGDKCDLCTDKHFWVISGYDVEDKFYCNWGWYGDQNTFYELRDLTPEGDKKEHDFRKNNMIVRNIYPDWNVTSDSELRNIAKGDDEELRAFCRNATLGNITLRGNSQSKIAFTQTLTIDGPFEVSGGATLTLACYDKELAAQQNQAKNAPEKEDTEWDMQDMQNEEPYTDEYSDLFHLSPNPATEEVQISMMPEACGPEAKEIFVYGMNGGLWYQTQFSYSYGIVPLSNLPSGMYLVRVVWEGYSVTKKLIVK